MSQMKEATSDRAKLDAVTQRKQIRERMSTMEHETLQFMLSNKGADLTTTCPQLTQWLQRGAVNTDETNPNEQGGPNDMELGSER
jgi:hypothetical protein